MDDAELTQFIQRHGLPNGDNDLPVDGWHKLSKDKRIHLSERIEAQQRSRAQSPKPCSRPLDLADLDARLRQVSLNTSFTLRPESETMHHLRSPTPPFDPTRRETDAYHDLVNAGGRPAYPIGLIQEVYRDPKDYIEILRPWQEYATWVSPSRIFQVQLQRWQDFRKWQNDNRDPDDDVGGLLAFVERENQAIERDYLDRTCRKRFAEIEADPSCLQSRWHQTQDIRQMQLRLCREHGCRGFREYIEAVKRRLARYGITQPFELDEDPKKQDKLTTWIEYLNYEYWWLDEYASDNKRLEAERDKLWKEFVETNLLSPHETKDTVLNSAPAMQVAVDRASTAVQSARLKAKRVYTLTPKDLKHSDIQKAGQRLMLKRAKEEVNAAKRHLKQAHKRSHFVTQFDLATLKCDDATRNFDRHRIIVQWVLDQLPLVESEVNLSNNNNW
ncbi:hypothetical protein MY11210_005420 [Beauveria gryllotalpidicola]